MQRWNAVTAELLLFGLLSGCSALQPPELAWETLPSVPLDCLRDVNCRVDKGDSPTEISREKQFDPNVSIGDAKVDSSLIKARFVNSQGAIEAIWQSAERQAKEAQKPQGIIQTGIRTELGTERLLPPRPPKYAGEAFAYSHSEQLLKCQTAFYAMRIAQSEKVVNKNDQETILFALYSRYVDACFEPAPAKYANRLVLFATSTENPSWQTQGVFCLGFAIDSVHVVTARHCLADPSTLDLIAKGSWSEDKVKLAPLPNSFLSFSDDLSKKISYVVSSIHATANDQYFYPKIITNDVAIVEILPGRHLSPFDVVAHKDWETLITFTTFIPAAQLRICHESGKCDLSHLVRADTSANCVTPVSGNGCMSHACQTRPGSSGGPILAIGNGVGALVGVHTGSIDKDTNEICKLPRPNVYSNYGITAESSATLRAILNER